ncbi:MAG TPA: hypothetical protein VEK15_20505 [Vicinamibacteria bacterium]|nr:hypothetical protein [Vicinamibacteria bacterium]
MYLSAERPERSVGRLYGDEGKLNVTVEGAQPVMAALPYMGVSGALLVSTVILPKDPQWAKVTKLILAAGGAGMAITGLISAFRTAKAMRPAGPVAPGAVPGSQMVPNLAEAKLKELIKIDFDPSQPETGGTTRSLFSDQEFEATVVNDSGKTYSFYPGIAAFDSDQTLRWRTPALQRQIVTLGPGESKTMGSAARAALAKKPEHEPVFKVPSSAAPWTWNTYSVEVELYRSRDDAQPFMTERIPIVYGYYGWPNAEPQAKRA